MSIRKLFIHAKALFQPEKFQKIQKKESMQRLLGKLKDKQETFSRISKENLSKKDLAELKEDLAIMILQIKKSEHILEKLSV